MSALTGIWEFNKANSAGCEITIDAQVLEYHPPKEHPGHQALDCTYVSTPRFRKHMGFCCAAPSGCGVRK